MALSKVFDAIEYLPSKVNVYVRDLAKLKAYEMDPKYREIEDKRHLNGSSITFFSQDLGLEDWVYQSETAKALTPSVKFWQKLVLKSQAPRHAEVRFRHGLQRFRRGYDDWAIHDFRSWHANHVALALQDFRDNLHGHPADRSIQQWEQDLDDLIAKFRLIATDGADDQQAIDDAMASLAKVYLHLWD